MEVRLYYFTNNSLMSTSTGGPNRRNSTMDKD